MQVQSLGGEDPLEQGMTTHSSILAWRIPWTEEPGGLQSMGLHRVRHNWACTQCIYNVTEIVKWYLIVVLNYFSLMTNGVRHILMYLFGIFFFRNIISKTLPFSLGCLSYYWATHFKNIFYIQILCWLCFANIFSQSVACLFIFITVSVEDQMFFILLDIS